MRYRIIIAFLFTTSVLFGQSPYILPGTITDEIADRWDILYDFEHMVFSSQRNVSRKEITLRALQISNESNLSKLERWDLQYILKDNNDYTSNERQGRVIDNQLDRIKVYDSTEVFYHLESVKRNYNTAEFGKREKPILKYFYKSEANFFELNEPNFTLRVNPILNLKYGNGADDSSIIFQNTRGAEIRGIIDNKI